MLLGVLLIIAFGTSFFTMHFADAQTYPTKSKFGYANNVVEQAFNAVLDAEKAGANVTDLLAQLNDAAGILAQAENIYRTGDYNTAVAQADSVLNASNSIGNQAQALQLATQAQKDETVNLSIIISAASVIVVIIASFLAWRFFKRSYYKRALQMKPEVVSDES